MTETDLELTGEGVIRQGFRLTGRGWIFLLEEPFSGRVAAGCFLEGPGGRTTIKAVEIAHSREGSEVKGWVALLIGESDRHLFEAGQPVKFYKKL